MEKHYSVKALSQLWDVPEKTIRSWMDSNALKRTRLCGRVVIAESEALRFLRDNNEVAKGSNALSPQAA